jgi:hypothetical protein
MDESFSFRAPVGATRRRMDPFARRAAVVGFVILAVGAAVGRVAVQSERASDARAEASSRNAAANLDDGGDHAGAIDAQARSGAEGALELAEGIYARTGDFARAGTAQLARLQPGLIFVDGPSTAPAIVSVRAAHDAWAAAVMSPSGVCLWVRATPDGPPRYGAGRVCTGSAAMSAESDSW